MQYEWVQILLNYMLSFYWLLESKSELSWYLLPKRPVYVSDNFFQTVTKNILILPLKISGCMCILKASSWSYDSNTVWEQHKMETSMFSTRPSNAQWQSCIFAWEQSCQKSTCHRVEQNWPQLQPWRLLSCLPRVLHPPQQSILAGKLPEKNSESLQEERQLAVKYIWSCSVE
jgi:hypothetical protein